jgi:glycosidase
MSAVFPALLCLLAGVIGSSGAVFSFDAAGADELRYGITKSPEGLDIRVLGAGVDRPNQAVFVALRMGDGSGASLLPAGKGMEGSPVWLPFQADMLLEARSTGDGVETFVRRWKNFQWGAREAAAGNFTATVEPAQIQLRLPQKTLGKASRIDLAVYMKDLSAEEGMGRFYGAMDKTAPSGTGERALRNYLSIHSGKDGATYAWNRRISADVPRLRIYQLMPRLFGNTNPARVTNGTLAQNGSGKFADLNTTSLAEIQGMGFTHIWLTGVLRQASGTTYEAHDLPGDDPDVLKGLAGNPFAIRDYFDVSPDYADVPSKRLDEFKAMVGRIHGKGLKVLMDFVPNHVARGYQSVVKPEFDFGRQDDRTKFFDPKNNFFYLDSAGASDGSAPPLRLPTTDGDGRPTSPTAQTLGEADGLLETEREFGRVTGNNIVSWAPAADSWYDTVKLNYGWNFAAPAPDARFSPNSDHQDLPVPDTWGKMDAVIAWWQGMGVDGFRVDHASMVPPEFWQWLMVRAQARDPQVVFIAHTGSEKKTWVPSGDANVAATTMGDAGLELLNAGFAAVEVSSVYEAVRDVYAPDGSANDIDKRLPHPFVFDNMVLYAENHETVRLASRAAWGGYGMAVGRPVSALIYGLSVGPVSLYHGQEVGERAEGMEGFGSDDGRTTIYDYWSMPEFSKWVNEGKFDGGLLSDEQKSLRDYYRRLLAVIDLPAFRRGGFYPLNPDNADNKGYGAAGEAVPGRWLYGYLRYDAASGQRVLVVVNLHPNTSMNDVRVRISPSAMRFLGWDALAGSKTVTVTGVDRLGEIPEGAKEWVSGPVEMEKSGLMIEKIPPLTAAYYELFSSPSSGMPAR